MIKKIIFDVDNTLIKWDDSNWDIIIELLKLYGSSDPFNDFKLVKEAYFESEENEIKMDEKILLKHLNNKLSVKVDLNFIDKVLTHWSKQAYKADIEVINLFKYLKDKYEIVIMTNAFYVVQRNRLDIMGLLPYINKIYSCDNNGLKPNKFSYMNVCGKQKPNNCVIIGDNIDLDYFYPIKYGLNAILFDEKNINNAINKITNLLELKNIL